MDAIEVLKQHANPNAVAAATGNGSHAMALIIVIAQVAQAVLDVVDEVRTEIAAVSK